MKNITVTVDEETYRKARIRAAEAETSVSALVRGFLTRFAQGESTDPDFERLLALQQDVLESIRSRGGGLASADNLDRASLHERRAIR